MDLPPHLSTPRSIAARINHRIVLWATIAALLACAVQALLVWRHSQHELADKVAEIGELHAPLLAARLADGANERVCEELRQIVAKPEIAGVRLHTRKGETFAEGEQPGTRIAPARKFALTLPELPEQRIGELEVFADPASLYEELTWGLLEVVIVFAALTLMLALLVARILRRDLEQPLQQMTRFVASLEPDRLSTPLELQRVRGRHQDEIDLLAQGIGALQVSLNEHIRRGEKDLERQLQLFSAFLDALPNPIFVKGTDAVFTACNRAYEEAFGIRRETFIGKTVLDLDYLPLAARQAFQAADLELIGQGGESNEEIEITYADGVRRTALYQRRTFDLADGEPGGMIGLIVDISARKRAERAEHFRRLTLEQLATDVPLPTILEALVRGVEDLDPELLCSVMLLDEAGERLGTTIASKLPEFFCEAIEGLRVGFGVGSCGAAAFTRQRVVVEDIASHPWWADFRDLAARAGLASCWSEPIRSPTGQVLGTFAIYHHRPCAPNELQIDQIEQFARVAGLAIERKRVSVKLAQNEARLRESERQLQMTFDNMQDGFIRTWLDGRIERVNGALVRMLGYDSTDELLHRRREDIYADPADCREVTRRMKHEDGMHAFRCQAQRRDGSKIWIEINAHPALDADGKVVALEGLIRDVTGQMTTELALKQAKEAAEAAARMKGEFLANMSHEIRTPMNAIIGLADLILRTRLTTRQQDYLEKLQTAAWSLLGILDDILDLSKMEAGKLRMESIAFDLDEVLDSVASVLAVQVERKGLELLFARGPGVPTQLIGDPLRLSQVLTNLVGNAEKFTERGEIIVTTERIAGVAQRVRLRFAVKDSGIGISADQQARLFRSFTQADNSTTRKFGGSGLGLAISRQLVEMMNGRIWMESEPGSGSTFTFEAEFGLGGQPADAALLPSPDLRGLKVLVVDDNPHARRILGNLLEQFSFRVEACAGAAESFARLQACAADDPFRLVMMDYRMPEIDGISASRRIKSELKLPTPPRVILVTAASRSVNDEEDLGIVDEVLSKPVNPSLLFNTVMEVFGDGSAMRRDRRTRSSFDMARLRPVLGAHILLVEDNRINRQVASELLEQAHFRVDVAENGAEAVAMLRKRAYDCVLMDIQMPVMDGYTATARIREIEGIRQPPIIAMTANVMSEDRAMVASVGMNGHVSKPIDPKELFATLLKWIVPRALPELPDPTAATETSALPAALPGLDLAAALGNVGGDREFLRKLLLEFHHDHAADARRLRDALAQADLTTSRRLAHTLKGIAATLAAAALQACAGQLETQITEGRSDDLASLLQELEDSLDTLMHGIAGLPPPANTLPAADSSGCDCAAVGERLDALERLLHDMDPEAAATARSLSAALAFDSDESIRLRLSKLEQEVDAFDFDAALRTLEALRMSLP